MTPPSDDDAFWEEMDEARFRRRRSRPTGRGEGERKRTGQSDAVRPERARLHEGPLSDDDRRRPRRPTVAAQASSPKPAAVDRPSHRGLAVAAGATGLVWLVFMLVRMFAGGPIGLADQGDGRRLICTFNVAASQPWGTETRAYVQPTYHHEQWWGESCGADGSGEPYNSTERWMLNGAKALTSPLGFPGELDLRALGVLCAAFVGLGVAAWVLVLPGRIWHRVAVASLAGLVYADSLIAPWFVSAYSEPAAMVGILFLGPALIWLWRTERTVALKLVLVAVLAMFIAAADVRAVAIVPAVVLGLLWTRSSRRDVPLMLAERPGRGVPRRARLVKGAQRAGERTVHFARTRALALCVVAALVFGSVLYIHAQPKRFAMVQKYDAFFGELLPNSPNGKGDLRSFGLPKSMIKASGTDVDSINAITRTPGFDAWNRKVSMQSIWFVYMRDPFRLVDLGTRGMHAVATGRVNYLGNFTKADGGAYRHDNRVPIFITLFRVSDKFLPLLALLWLLTLGWGWGAAKNRRFSTAEQGVGRFAVVLVFAIATEFWITALTEGSVEYVKHMILTDLLTAFCFPTILALRLAAWRHRDDPARSIS
ncbi:MAG: hypothetical protein ABI276_02625 [Acidimicrobiales bacterium]